MNHANQQSAPDPEPSRPGAWRVDDAAVKDLIAQLRGGSESARTWLYSHLLTHAVVLAGIYLKRDLAEDVAHSLLIEMLGPLPGDKPPGILRYEVTRPFHPWFERAVANRAIDRLRSETSRVAREREVAVRQHYQRNGSAEIERAAVHNETLERLQKVRRTLLTTEDNALLERWMNREPYDTIAAAFGIPVGTVASRLHKIRRILKDHFREQV